MNNINEKELIAATRIQRDFRDCFRLSYINAAITIQRMVKAYYLLPHHQAAVITQRTFDKFKNRHDEAALSHPASPSKTIHANRFLEDNCNQTLT